jgi:hypothetical protein
MYNYLVNYDSASLCPGYLFSGSKRKVWGIGYKMNTKNEPKKT